MLPAMITSGDELNEFRNDGQVERVSFRPEMGAERLFDRCGFFRGACQYDCTESPISDEGIEFGVADTSLQVGVALSGDVVGSSAKVDTDGFKNLTISLVAKAVRQLQ